LKVGGNPSGPMWATDTPVTCTPGITNTWQGAASADWHLNSMDWSLSRLPGTCDHVTLQTGISMHIKSPAIAKAFTLTIPQGAELSVEAGAELSVRK
ncbi:MAG: hypothetical protein HKN76_10240, partial [Saprospiraceae bacterium]|nr:hypothetical protein [Saprospiraceae bacterium]